MGIDAEPSKMVDLILQQMVKDKPKTDPYYFSDMVPFTGVVKTDLHVYDYRIKTYPLTTSFDLSKLSNKAVHVYHNGEQILHGRDYSFSDQGFVVISDSVDLKDDEIYKVCESYLTAKRYLWCAKSVIHLTTGLIAINSCIPLDTSKLSFWKYEN